MAFGSLYRHFDRNQALVKKGKIEYGPGKVFAMSKHTIVRFHNIAVKIDCRGPEGLYTLDGYKVDLVVQVALRLDKRDKAIMRALHVFGLEGMNDAATLQSKFNPDLIKLLTGITINSLWSGISQEITTRLAAARSFEPINQRGFIITKSRVLHAELTALEHLNPDDPRDQRNFHELQGS